MSNLLEVTRRLAREAINFTNKEVFFNILNTLFQAGVYQLTPVSLQNDMEALNFSRVSYVNHWLDCYIHSPSIVYGNKTDCLRDVCMSQASKLLSVNFAKRLWCFLFFQALFSMAGDDDIFKKSPDSFCPQDVVIKHKIKVSSQLNSNQTIT